MAYTLDITAGQSYDASNSVGDANSPADGSGCFDDSTPALWSPTWWASPTFAGNEWVRIDFGDPVIVNQIIVHHGASGNGGQTGWKHFIFQGSDNDSDWTKIPATDWIQNASAFNTDESQFTQTWYWPPGITTSSIVQFNSNTTAYRYIRCLIVTNWGMNALTTYEIEMMTLIIPPTISTQGLTGKNVIIGG
ncbi:MAG: discoidin domain-containing protein [Anaerolineales bacterium]|nr:discoidin domain-containing protein [Anaerolineales bacterium]